MAAIAEEEKKKRGSYGDASAAALDAAVTQPRYGKPGDFPLNPVARPKIPRAGALPLAPLSTPPAYVPGSLPAIGQEIPLAPGVQQGLANQTAMYVQGAQAANPPGPVAQMANPAQGAALSKYEAELKSANDQAAARLARPVANANAAQVTTQYLELQQKANDLKPSYFSQTTPTSAALLAQAQSEANNALGAIYTQNGQPAPAAPPAAQQLPAMPKTGMGDATMPGADMARFAAPAQAPVDQPATGVPSVIRRIDAPGKSPLFTNVGDADNAALMARGTVGAQNMGAAQTLAAQYAGSTAQPPAEPAEGFRPAVIRNSTNDWQARNNLRNLEVSASSITNKRGGRNGVSPSIVAYLEAQKADQALIAGNDPSVISANRDGAFMDRTQAAERAANTRFGLSNQLAQQKAGQEQVKLGIEARAAAQLQAASDAVVNAKTPAERDTAAKNLAVLQGRYQQKDPQNKYTVVPGGQTIDPATGQAYTVPARVLDNQTGKFVDQAQEKAPAYPEGTRLTGPDKKQYIVKNGVPEPV